MISHLLIIYSIVVYINTSGVFKTTIRQILSKINIWKDKYAKFDQNESVLSIQLYGIKQSKDQQKLKDDVNIELNKELKQLVTQIIQVQVFGISSLQKKVKYKIPGKVLELTIGQALNVISSLMYKRSVRFSRMVSDTFDQTYYKDERILRQNIYSLRNAIAEILKERRKELLEQKDAIKITKNQDLLTFFICQDIHDKLNDSEIIDECISYLFMSVKNVNLTLQNLWDFILSKGKVKEQILEEIDQIFSISFLQDLQPSELDKLLTNRTLTQLTYLNSCIQETLRLRPPEQFSYVFTTTKDLKLDNQKFIIKQNQPMSINIGYIHTHKDFWVDESNKIFYPDRFTEQNIMKDQIQQKQLRYLPFLQYSYNQCMGQQIGINIIKAIVTIFYSHLDVVLIERKRLLIIDKEQEELS